MLAVIFRDMVWLWNRLMKKARDRTGFEKDWEKGGKRRLDLKQQQIDVAKEAKLAKRRSVVV